MLWIIFHLIYLKFIFNIAVSIFILLFIRIYYNNFKLFLTQFTNITQLYWGLRFKIDIWNRQYQFINKIITSSTFFISCQYILFIYKDFLKIFCYFLGTCLFVYDGYWWSIYVCMYVCVMSATAGGGPNGGGSGGGPGGGNKQHTRARRTQRRVTHNEKRYHSGIHIHTNL